MLTFEVTSFDIGYNCIFGRHFLLKFMAIIHIAYAIIKMLGPKGDITTKVDQRDALACEITSLLHVGRFDDKTTQDQSAKSAQTQGDSVPYKTSTSKLPNGGTSRSPTAPKGAHTTSASNHPPAD
jgi:hypothetical protein